MRIPLEALPNCRWRGGHLPSGNFRCFSPLLRISDREIDSTSCAGCSRRGWLDHDEGTDRRTRRAGQALDPPRCAFLSRRVRDEGGSVLRRLCTVG